MMIMCLLRGHETLTTINKHLNKKHGLEPKEYRSMFPGADVYSDLARIRQKARSDYRKKHPAEPIMPQQYVAEMAGYSVRTMKEDV